MYKSACFTGHRNIVTDKVMLSEQLYVVLEKLITSQGVTDFYAGGAYGFDALASFTVLKLRESYPQVKLHLILPCSKEEQSIKWTEEQKAELEKLLGLADSVEYVSNRYYNGCMKDRNARLVKLATECCISYWNPNDFRSGSGQTVRMAQKKGIEVINLFETQSNADKSPVTD